MLHVSPLLIPSTTHAHPFLLWWHAGVVSVCDDLTTCAGDLTKLTGMETLCNWYTHSYKKQVKRNKQRGFTSVKLVSPVVWVVSKGFFLSVELLRPSLTYMLQKYFIWLYPFFCLYRLIRVSASDQFFYIVTKANSNPSLLVSFISLLFSAVEV